MDSMPPKLNRAPARRRRGTGVRRTLLRLPIAFLRTIEKLLSHKTPSNGRQGKAGASHGQLLPNFRDSPIKHGSDFCQVWLLLAQHRLGHYFDELSAEGQTVLSCGMAAEFFAGGDALFHEQDGNFRLLIEAVGVIGSKLGLRHVI